MNGDTVRVGDVYVGGDQADHGAGTGSIRKSSRSEPQRTCVGCRGKGGRSVLLRITCDDDGTSLVLDSRRSRSGRGAWLHADAGCLEKAVKRRAWSRALRLRTAVDTAAMQAQVAQEICTMSSSDDEYEHDRKRV